MPTLFKLSEGVNLAFHATMILAAAPQACLDTATLAKKLNASSHHLSKVLQQLQRARLIKSIRGPKGGFQLAQAPDQITLLAVYEIMEGPCEVRDCLFDATRCAGEGCCGVGTFLGRMGREFTQLLAETTLADLTGRWSADRTPPQP